MNAYTSIEKEDIRKRIADKKRLAERDGHKDAYWYSLLDTLYGDLVNSLKYHPETDIGDLATKEYVDKAIEKAQDDTKEYVRLLVRDVSRSIPVDTNNYWR